MTSDGPVPRSVHSICGRIAVGVVSLAFTAAITNRLPDLPTIFTCTVLVTLHITPVVCRTYKNLNFRNIFLFWFSFCVLISREMSAMQIKSGMSVLCIY